MSSEKKPIVATLVEALILALMLVGLPLLGVYLGGLPVYRYLQFPPKIIYVRQAPFSWMVFACYFAAVLTVILFFLYLWWKGRENRAISRLRPAKSFPWWGWLGVAAGLISWVLAWSRFPWFSNWQLHTFTPLWLSFIVVINALSYRLKGQCMMINQPRLFFMLFPVSSIFWWFFEYLNRFVQNWHYLGADYGAVEYFLLATLPFSTVLPAVLSVREWFLSHPHFASAFRDSIRIRPSHPRALAWLILAGSALGLAAIGVFSNYLFPLLWLSPGLIILSLQVINGERHVLSDIVRGDWSVPVASALAALFCGWFWEMWNYLSLVRWEYSIPYVNRFHIFEMPILGYAGYLPFGLECAVVGGLVSDLIREDKCEPAFGSSN